jgi:hypothetical protein
VYLCDYILNIVRVHSNLYSSIALYRFDVSMIVQWTTCIEVMLYHDADTNFKDEEGYTVIHYFAASWQYEHLRTIIDHENSRCNLYSYSTSGMTALHHTADSNSLKLAISDGTRILNNNRKYSAGASDECGSTIQKHLEELLLENGIPTLSIETSFCPITIAVIMNIEPNDPLLLTTNISILYVRKYGYVNEYLFLIATLSL